MRAVVGAVLDSPVYATPEAARAEMARRLPRSVQPFLTWLTALPEPGTAYRGRSALHHVIAAFVSSFGGAGLSVLALLQGGALHALLPIGLLATTSGMGALQAVISHHCAHGTVFKSRYANRVMGNLITLLLIIKDFAAYQKEHMLHHSPKKLLTHEDEFLDYMTRFLGAAPGMSKATLWRKALWSFVSPAFHLRLFRARFGSCFFSADPVQNWIRRCAWIGALGLASVTSTLPLLLVAWLLPAVLLFQIATTLRVLAEHRYPDPALLARRDRHFVGRATAGVFAGEALPADAAAFAGWWARMLTIHVLSRIFVLVGDAPAHDYHHRRPGSRSWPSYIHERARDRAEGCRGFPVNYIGTLGLLRAIDENLASLAAAGPDQG